MTSLASLPSGSASEAEVEKTLTARVSWRRSYRQLGIAIAFGVGGAIAFSGHGALAQIQADGTVGTTVNSSPSVACTTFCTIEGGTSAGSNLFHSFTQFSIPTGGEAFFNNGATIQNIISRITGSSQSNIEGLIRANGTANLFLLNPNGIIFGPNARLNIGGSFVATSANAIQFGEQGSFSTPDLSSSPSVLTVNPSAFLFNQIPGPIINQSKVGLQVQPNQNLWLLGGNVNLDGGVLRAPAGRIELGGLASSGTVTIQPYELDPNELSLSFPDGVARADVSLTNGAIADVVARGDGDIVINAKTIDVSGASLICAGLGTASSCNTPESGFQLDKPQAGNIIFNATDTVRISQSSRVESDVNPGSSGNSENIFDAVNRNELFGSILISTGSLELIDGAQISTSTFGNGSAGVVFVDADKDVLIENSQIFSAVSRDAVGDAGGILIQAGSLSLNESLLNSSTFGQGKAGIVSVETTGSVSLNGANTEVSSAVGETGVGEASGILIKAGSLSMTNGALLNASSFNQGNAGLISVTTTGSVSLENGSIMLSGVADTGVGDAGGIAIKADSVFLTSGSQLTTQTLGLGNGGVVLIQANNNVSVTGSGTAILSNVEEGATGNVIGIRIDARSLFMDGGANLQALTRGNGNAGLIIINASDSVNLKGVSPDGFSTGLLTSTEDNATGPGGFLIVNTNSLRLYDGTVLSARTRNAFAGGDILVTVNELEATNGGQILATAFSSGRAGRILVIANDRIVLSGRDETFSDRFRQTLEQNIQQFGPDQGLSIALQTFDNVAPGSSGLFANTSAGSDAAGGGIAVITRDLIIEDKAQITVNNQGSGTAGNLGIVASGDIRLDNGTITAETASGQGGDIAIAADGILLLLNNSEISTTAGTAAAGGDGGNIEIDVRFGIAAPGRNNDIRANAFTGNGGNVQIRAGRLYDIEERNPGSIQTNDITASSEFGIDGTISSNVLNVDPTQGLTNLPVLAIDPTTLIAETCAPRRGVAQKPNNQFVVTGRGGLPPDPNAAFPGEAVINDWNTPDGQQENGTDNPSSDHPSGSDAAAIAPSQQPPLVEAQGWVYGENGKIIFTAQSPTVTPNSPALTPASTCNAL
ncbi:MAG TPA: filamentous hemagglutinin N-terminal domain-containing protein [Coleofasciculaceae cyanobacterium]